jgi:probable rRNA maturation factor
MNATTKQKNAANKNAESGAEVGPSAALTIGISGKTPAVSRIELRRWAKTILRHLNQTPAELSIALVTDPEIHSLNRQYRQKDKPTDVLSFPLADDLCPALLGDVVISIDTATRQAHRRGHSLREEIQTLLIHGVLHLLGYDHAGSRREAIRMHKKEREIQALLGITKE